MVDDDLCSKCTSYRPIRICFLNCFLNTTDISNTAIVERSTKAYDENFVLSNIICVQRIILGSISGISSEIIRICILSLYELLLCICQLIPCCFCCCTLLVCLIGSLLYINVIDQFCNFICSCLIICLGCL